MTHLDWRGKLSVRWAALLTVVALGAGVAVASRSTPRSGHGSPKPPARLAPPVGDPWEPVPAALPTPPRTSRTVTVPRAWRDGQDFAAAWATWLRRVPNGSTIAFPAGTYRTSDWLLVQRRADLVLQGPPEGQPARIELIDDGRGLEHGRERSAIVVHSSQRIVVQHLTVVGANPRARDTDPMRNPLEGQHGITATWDSRDVQILDNTVSDTFGDGIATQGRTVRTLIAGNRISNVGRQGISSLDAFDTTIRGNDIADTALDGVDVEPNRAGARVLVASNHLSGKGATLNASGPMLSDVTFADNTFEGPLRVRLRAWPRPGGEWERLTRIVVTGNRGTAPRAADRPDIEALNVDFLTLRDNRAGAPTGTLWLVGSCPVRLPATDGRATWEVRFTPAPRSGSAPEQAPGALLSVPSDRLDPVPWIDDVQQRITGRQPAAAQVATAATRMCTGRADRATLASDLLASGSGPLQDQAREITTRLLAEARAAVAGAAAPAVAPGEVGDRDHAETTRKVVTAYLVARRRVPDTRAAAAWLRVARSDDLDEVQLLRQMFLRPLPITHDTEVGGCNALTDALTLASPSAAGTILSLSSLAASC